jgi:hypothetical protein
MGIAVTERDACWTVELNGVEVIECGLIRRYDALQPGRLTGR